jgi:hypothetical protein
METELTVRGLVTKHWSAYCDFAGPTVVQRLVDGLVGGHAVDELIERVDDSGTPSELHTVIIALSAAIVATHTLLRVAYRFAMQVQASQTSPRKEAITQTIKQETRKELGNDLKALEALDSSQGESVLEDIISLVFTSLK